MTPSVRCRRCGTTVRPEEVDTTGEDHAGDDVRYACMSRPWVPPAKAAPVRVPGRGAMGGWGQVRARFVGDADGRAMMVFF